MSRLEPDEFIDAIIHLYDRWGSHPYDERISQTEHALQCAQLARDSGAQPSLVVACLLHDVGHLLSLERQGGRFDASIDDSHESIGAAFLARGFGPSVTAPIALHVQAKRYLCAIDDGYLASLSEGSTRSLAVQGGPMNVREVGRFLQHPTSGDAITLRRWDDRGKSRVASGLTFQDFVDELTASTGRPATS